MFNQPQLIHVAAATSTLAMWRYCGALRSLCCFASHANFKNANFFSAVWREYGPAAAEHARPLPHHGPGHPQVPRLLQVKASGKLYLCNAWFLYSIGKSSKRKHNVSFRVLNYICKVPILMFIQYYAQIWRLKKRHKKFPS